MNGLRIENLDRIVGASYLGLSLTILVVAALLRFYGLGASSLWFDEAVYAHNSMTDFSSFMENTRNKNSSPILLPYLYHLFGENLRDAFLVRIPPAIFSLLSVAVVLALPAAGLGFAVSALAAFILAISPEQIEYGQEVREYSLAVLFSCALIFSYAYAVNRPGKRSLFLFALLLLVAPFASYGVILLSLAAVAVFVAIGMRQLTYRVGELLIPVASLFVGIVLTYQLTAKYQMGIARVWYLGGFYPPGELLGSLKWLAKHGTLYFSQALGGWRIGFLSIALVLFYTVASMRHSADWLSKNYLLAVLIVLVAGSVLAAAIGIYPFGGIRQHLFATPLIVLCVAQSAISLGSALPSNGLVISVVAFALAVTASAIPKMPGAYAEREDIVSAVSEGLEGVPDSEVYVYYAARPALNFHYPEHEYFLGGWMRGDIEGIGREIVARVGECNVSVLFSHVFRDEDDQILAYLKNSGLKPKEDLVYSGARVVKLSRCALEDPQTGAS